MNPIGFSQNYFSFTIAKTKNIVIQKIRYIYLFLQNSLNRYDNNFAAMALFISSNYLRPN